MISETYDQWRAAFSVRECAIVLLDGVEVGDVFECFGGNRRRPRGSEFIEAAANMGPAESKLYIVALGEHPITGIAVDLQDTREAAEVSDRQRSHNRPSPSSDEGGITTAL